MTVSDQTIFSFKSRAHKQTVRDECSLQGREAQRQSQEDTWFPCGDGRGFTLEKKKQNICPLKAPGDRHFILEVIFGRGGLNCHRNAEILIIGAKI